MTLRQKICKRTFDIIVSLIGLSLTWWIILIAFVVASVETRSNGFFIQMRVGRMGKLFPLIKIKTMRPIEDFSTTITTAHDPRITRSGAFFRKTKIDELPQLINVVLGHMSLVGPRPDVSGYTDALTGDDAEILTLRPGITGPATLKYKDEENILASQDDPKRYNDEIIWPDKVRLNRRYIHEWSFMGDIGYLWRTVFS